jgi:hypothetical protein
MLFPSKHKSLFIALTIFASLAAAGSAHAQNFWQGTTTDITAPSNWSGGNVPAFGTSTATAGFITAGGTANMIYTAAQGTTTFTDVGGYEGLAWISAYGGAQTTEVTGGTLNLNGLFGNDGGNESLWVANGPGVIGTLAITGGSVSTGYGVLIGRDTSTGALSISNGSFTAGAFSTAVGTYIGAPFSGGAGTATLTLDNGGQFTMTASVTDPFSFGTALASTPNPGTTDYIDFTTGSTGKITLNLSGATLGTSYFNDLVTNGYVEIGGTPDTTVGDYVINTTDPTAASLSLAGAVPEPSSFAAILLAVAAGAVCWRRRAVRA